MAEKIYIADKPTLDNVKSDTVSILEQLYSEGSPTFVDSFIVKNSDYTLKNVLDIHGTGCFAIRVFVSDIHLEIDGRLITNNSDSGNSLYYNGYNFSSNAGSINIIPFDRSLKIDFARNMFLPAEIEITYWLS